MRTRLKTRAMLATLALALPAALGAQTQTPATGAASQPVTSTPTVRAPALPGPPVRRIESAAAVSTDTLMAITNVRALPGGRLLLNDGTRRRLLMLDSNMKTVGIVLDSLTDVENAYGTRSGALVAYRGDSTLFIDAATYAMLVIDPAGKIVRVRSVPRAQDVGNLSANSGNGYPAFDASGRLVYRISAQAARPVAPMRSDMPYIPSPPDSAFIVGIHLDTRKVDTIGVVRAPKVVYSVVKTEYGYDFRSASNPLPLIDDWAVLSDGTVTFVRGRDYRIDFLNADSTMGSSDKLPFPWTRMTDDDKTHFADSAKAVQTKQAKDNFVMQMISWSNLLNKPYPAKFEVHEGFTLTPGLPRDWILPKGVLFPANYIYACPPNVPGAPAPTATASASGANGAPAAPPCRPNVYSGEFGNGYTPPAPVYRAPTFIPASELPDYKPPLQQGAARADADGNLWIRPVQLTPVPGGLIYDIVNHTGMLVDRVQLPPGYAIAGFAPGRTVYLSMRDASGLHLARVQLR